MGNFTDISLQSRTIPIGNLLGMKTHGTRLTNTIAGCFITRKLFRNFLQLAELARLVKEISHKVENLWENFCKSSQMFWEGAVECAPSTNILQLQEANVPTGGQRSTLTTTCNKRGFSNPTSSKRSSLYLLLRANTPL